ncbi:MULTISPECIES: DUF4292 domain-containing protein [Larkinella]|jgi:hypothetical protein|uniref:DUF4292 domain-containing protein n=1 Tax=Larkinella humicola TaxID=2607654 RepID=A0A5N1JF70_9BACT|nr:MULTISPECIES: DUF4292 domain-containing protein [Larkinella]KAA9354036.1 DUF4292 domain-containing protein [Larkinella humicola]
MSKYLIGLLCVIMLCTSEGCRRRRLFRNAPPSPTADTVSVQAQTPIRTDTIATAPVVSSVDPKATVDQVDFAYLTAKSKVSFKSKDQDINNANVNLRIDKDSLIWLSVSGVGVEVARALITKDSVVIMDRIHREYSVYDYASLSQRFNFNLTFGLIQSLLIGNLPLPQEPAQRVKNEKDYLLLRQREGKVMVDNYIGEENRKLKKLLVVEQPTRNSLTLDYEDFTVLNNFLFPYTSLVTVDYKSKNDGQPYQTVLRIRHNKVELTDKNPGFPFSIPPKYQRRP